MTSRKLPLRRLRYEWTYYAFIVPSLGLIAVFAYLPAASALYHSFFEWSGAEQMEFVGLGNFRRMLGDTVFLESFGVIAVLIVANVLKLIPSILVAVLIHRLTSGSWQYVYRILVVLPMVVPSLVTLFIWKFFFDPNFGALNTTLDATGLKSGLVALSSLFGWDLFHEGVPIAWLSTPELIVPALVLWGFPWLGTVGVLVYLAGLQSIDKELYEAADLDGAGSLSKFIYIELPLIMTQIRLTLILLVIGTLQGYAQNFLLLGPDGGPGRAGMVPGLWMFNRAFVAGEFGYACALGVVLFFVILGLTWLNNRYVRVER